MKESQILTSGQAFELAEKYTKSKCVQINSYWLLSNGYYKVRKQKDKKRATYYIKSV